MSVLPDLERELHRVAARPRRRLLPATRGGMLLLTGFVVAGGVAGAAGLALVGPDPHAHEHFDQEIPVAITGKPVRAGTLLPIRAADPDGGPPWGIRVTATSRGASCIQVGRVVENQLVALGRDGAFDDDGRAHVLPQGRDICVPTAADGTPLLKSRPGTPTSSGLGMCQPQTSRAAFERRNREAPGRFRGRVAARAKGYVPASDAEWRRIEEGMCPPGSGRAIRWGFLGPRATEAHHRVPGARVSTQGLPRGGRGAYLFVRRIADGERPRFDAIQRPGTVWARFGTSALVQITGPGHARRIPGLTPLQVDRRRGPVGARFTLPRRPTDPVRVTFRAPVDALRYPTTYKAYAEVRPSDDAAAERCRKRTTTGTGTPVEPVTPPMRKGERATLTVTPPDRFAGERPTWCPGRYRLRLIQVGGSPRGSIPLASRTFTVR